MPIEIDSDRLQRLLGGKALAALRQRLRERYAREAGGDTFTLPRLTPAERAALEGLLGRRAARGDSMRVSQTELDAALARAEVAPNLESALEALDGPIPRRKRERLARGREWSACFATATDVRLQTLLTNGAGQGLLKRLSGSDPQQAAQLLSQAACVLQRLPGGGIPLPRLAADTCGDAHGLDAGRALGTLVLAACASDSAAPDDSEDTRLRNRWAQLGVSLGELSAPALVLNLPAHTDTPGGRLAALAGESGEPLHLTLRTLLRQPPNWCVDNVSIHVCENPTIVALAAERLGERCPPMVCTDGMPAAAQRTLLDQLARAGARLRYHGDFDWAGLRIGNFVMRRFGAVPWRFGAPDYRQYAPRQGRTLEGPAVTADWDVRLSLAMLDCGYALDEETVVETLIEDLALA
ncbi:MAG: TIGR02679 family protein [Pseudomonadota bacterium]|jgi:uncharacterized protein (TIGR02679 family)|nr:TIGR02679 family protein [Pseudomonadota bacterium]